MDLPHKYRPKNTDELVGQETVVSIMKGWKTVPQAILLVGPSGCGKTTTARIIRKLVKCGKDDFAEINCADFRGIEMVRDIRARMNQSPMAGESRVWLIDEAHQLSTDAQNALLKILEDPPRRTFKGYFILATTDPQKLKPTILTRCRQLKFKSVKDSDIEELVKGVAKREKTKLDPDVLTRISEVADGSPRKALVILESVLGIKGSEAQLDAISKSDSMTFGFKVAQMLLDTRTRWIDMGPKLKDLEEEPETIRRIILGYMSSVLVSGKGNLKRAALVSYVFQDNYFDSGKNGLIRNCYEVIVGMGK